MLYLELIADGRHREQHALQLSPYKPSSVASRQHSFLALSFTHFLNIMATLRQTPLQLPPNALIEKSGIIDETIIDESNTEPEHGTEAKPGDSNSVNLSQYDVVFRNKPFQCQNNSAESEPGSSTTNRSHNIDLVNDTCPTEGMEKGMSMRSRLIQISMNPDNQFTQ